MSANDTYHNGGLGKMGGDHVASPDMSDLDEGYGTSHSGNEYEQVKTGEELQSYVSEVAETVRSGLDQSIAVLTPWFFSNMPSIYYQTTPRAEKVRHLSGIISGHIFETKQTLELWDRDRAKVTYIGPGSEHDTLFDLSRRLATHAVKMGSIYFSHDRLLCLSSFFSSGFVPVDPANSKAVDKIAIARRDIAQEFPEDKDGINQYVEHLDNDFVMYATPARLQLTYRMVRHMRSHEGAHTFIQMAPDSSSARITIGMKNVNVAETMEQIFLLMGRYGFQMVRSFVVKFEQGFDEPITVIHFIINPAAGGKLDPASVPLIKFNKALRTLGWVDADEFSSLMQQPYNVSINGVNLIRGIACFVHVMLGKHNTWYYSQYKIRQTLFKHHELTLQLVELFRLRFDPMQSGERDKNYEPMRSRLSEKATDLIDEVERTIFQEAIKFIDATLKTNYFMPTKTGLAFRLAPEVLDAKFYPEKPFGIFFIIGHGYRFFQVRWKDISRGGLRVVMPRNPTEHDFALAGLFDEVYGLSHAQQLKNKDIPEGGSKAVLLLKPAGHRQQAVRGAVNALLDLLVKTDESHEATAAQLVSYYEKDEIIYLGPDENITNDLIEWIPEQAARRGYPYAAAFMSSKPGAGINHKEYGVTSEGVNVFVENALKFVGIDPRKQKFTVKITGGPDGDVAGNELKILHREYGENARVVAIADGFGAAFDPDGLKWSELLRLFKAGLPIPEFNASLLSGAGAYVIKADTPENMRKRNELYAVIPADIFIPAGGRPYTVNEKNWSGMLDAKGKPTAKAIVEGANIFFTGPARKLLQEAGVVMVKDSTANKCGVICSSYEIISSLVLSTKEFLAIKETYVSQVIDILRQKADFEAKLLFREYARPGNARTLVELSMDISREINVVTDALLDELTSRESTVLKDPFFQSLVLKHCPPVLVEKYRERILDKLPAPHRIAILAAFIASYIVYREGLGWLERIPPKGRYKACITYMKQDMLTEELIAAVEGSAIANKDKIAAILRMSAARDLTILELEGRR
jgi:glutamate dehydrogenase